MGKIAPNIPAARNWLGNELIYRLLIERPLRKTFSGVWAQVYGTLPERGEGPLICYMTHSCWWDGYMSAVINRSILRRGGRHFVMMEERQLRQFQFFRWAGCFSVDREDAREASRSIAYISGVLRERPGDVLYMFPQGEIVPTDRRPLQVFSGLAHIVKRLGGALLAPVAFRYEFGGDQLPHLFIRFGPVHRADTPLDVHRLTGEIGERLTASADGLRDTVVNGDMSEFRLLLRGRRGIDQVFGGK